LGNAAESERVWGRFGRVGPVAPRLQYGE